MEHAITGNGTSQLGVSFCMLVHFPLGFRRNLLGAINKRNYILGVTIRVYRLYKLEFIIHTVYNYKCEGTCDILDSVISFLGNDSSGNLCTIFPKTSVRLSATREIPRRGDFHGRLLATDS